MLHKCVTNVWLSNITAKRLNKYTSFAEKHCGIGEYIIGEIGGKVRIRNRGGFAKRSICVFTVRGSVKTGSQKVRFQNMGIFPHFFEIENIAPEKEGEQTSKFSSVPIYRARINLNDLNTRKMRSKVISTSESFNYLFRHDDSRVSRRRHAAASTAATGRVVDGVENSRLMERARRFIKSAG